VRTPNCAAGILRPAQHVIRDGDELGPHRQLGEVVETRAYACTCMRPIQADRPASAVHVGLRCQAVASVSSKEYRLAR
jgi:hypothetical protein